jgi:cysteine-rich repeat protein
LLSRRRVISARRSFAALAVVLAMSSAGHAAPLLSPIARDARALPAGVSRGRTLALDASALADHRGRSSAVVPAFPLGDDGTADLVLRRFEPFSPAARVETVTDAGVRDVPLPDQLYFSGEVAGDPRSRAFLVARGDRVHGFVVTNGEVYAFGPDGRGRHRSYALRDADPTTWPPPGDFCANDLHPAEVAAPTVNEQAGIAEGLLPPPVPLVAATTLVQADVAVETDHELWAKFGSDSGTLDYLASLVAADTAIYERDVAVHLRFSYIRLWATTSDPWSATTTSGQLTEVRNYWNAPANDMSAIAGPHALVHFVSGKSVQGGIAYIGTVCNASYAFGVSQVFGSFDLSNPSQIWDVLVTAHEMGHNFGTPHTHCYSPPVDKCYNQETGCYNGQIVASRGTIMSYCHLLSGGLTNIDLVFGDAVSTRIRNTVGAATCLQALGTCGNGTVEPGEQCDDGNTAAGDGCSPTCRLEGCGNGIVDPGEQCDDGNTVPGDGCSATCQREPRCGDGVVDSGEQCDDGNTVSGDGCSATCRREPCKIVRSGQTIWGRSQIMVQQGATGRGRMTLHVDFNIPMPVSSLSLPTAGMLLELDDGAGAPMVDATLPPGPRWTSRRGRWTYRDPAGTVAGIRRVDVVDATRGGVPEVAITVTARNGSYPVAAGDLPGDLMIVLGDDTAGLAGACGKHDFGGASCTSNRAGTRISCR